MGPGPIGGPIPPGWDLLEALSKPNERLGPPVRQDDGWFSHRALKWRPYVPPAHAPYVRPAHTAQGLLGAYIWPIGLC